MSNKALVQVRDLVVERDGRRICAVESFEVLPGQHWAVIGANGSGKSTLLSVLAARLWPTSGHVDLLGERVGRTDMRALRGRLGLLSSSLTRQLREQLVAHDVVVTGRDGALEPWWVTYSEEDHRRADSMLEQLGLRGYGPRELSSMSEGERTTVMLARVLMAEPEVLLLDEPASGLDLGARERLLGLLDTLARDLATPRVMVSHHLEELPASTSHAIVFKSGSVIAQGAAEDVITSGVISEAFDVDVTVERLGHGRYVVHAKS